MGRLVYVREVCIDPLWHSHPNTLSRIVRQNHDLPVLLQPEVEAATKAHLVAADLVVDLVEVWEEGVEVVVDRFTSPTFVTLSPFSLLICRSSD